MAVKLKAQGFRPVELVPPGGEPETHHLYYSLESLAWLSETTGQPIQKIFEQLEGEVPLRLVTQMVAAGLLHEGNRSASEVASMIPLDRIPEVVAAMGEALTAAFPDASGSKKKAEAGTGGT